MRIATIVEGHGECEAVPILIRRIAQRLGKADPPEIDRPIRIPKSRLLKETGIERAVDLAARLAGPDGRILVLVDADDDCPAEVGPALLSRAKQSRYDRRIGVVLAKREFEAWFLAALPSLAGHRTISPGLPALREAELVRDAKGTLSSHMESGYSPAIDQASLTTAFDLDLARATSSFDKCYREICRLLE